MKLTAKAPPAKLPATELLIVLACEKRAPELPGGVKLPAACKSDFKGEAREVRTTDADGGPAKRLMLVGLGPEKKLDAEGLRRAAGLAVRRAEALGAPSATLRLEPVLAAAAGGTDVAGQALAEGALLGAYAYKDHKSKPKPTKLKALELHGDEDFRRGAKRGEHLAAGCAFARDLQNAPANKMTPSDLAAAARKLATRSARITCKVHDEAAMERMGMGLLLGVAQGSTQPAKLIHLTYKPTRGALGRVALVGKGLTFDAGGYSLKPAAKMDEMRYDMSGGAAVLGAFHALAKLDVPWEVHGIVPASENLIDGNASKPGDVFTAMDGTTVEVLNTDAEGRLILADALAYARQRVKAEAIVDLATLTGAVVVALGHELSGMFASSERLGDELRRAGDEVGEALWPLPLLDVHKEAMKGATADLKNIGGADVGAGSSQGAAFLAHFAGDTEWAHLDIAGAAWGAKSRDWVGGPQGTGVGARLLVRWLELRGAEQAARGRPGATRRKKAARKRS